MKRNIFNIKSRIIFVSVLLLVINIVVGSVLLNQSRNTMISMINNRMLDLVNTAADMLDGDSLEKITGEDLDTPDYKKIINTLFYFYDNTELEFIYALREEKDGTFIMIADPALVDASEYGELIHQTPALYEAAKGKASVDSKPYTDDYGTFYSAYSPVLNSAGKITGIVAGDFPAAWYESQINSSARIILLGVISSFIISLGIIYLLSHGFIRQFRTIREDLADLSKDIDSLTKELSGRQQNYDQADETESILTLGKRISTLRNDLRNYVSQAKTQANSMITAMASDYRSVYYVDLDRNDGVCYRGDHNDHAQTKEGVHFPYLERFTWYADNSVTDSYREGFKRFIDPDNVREALANQPIIAYRYLASREGREYYEMIRMAGVRRPEDRDDHIVHAIGLGLTEIDSEMRESMEKNHALAEALILAEEANTAKTAVLSSMSHEIRTPMNAIIGLDTLALHDDTLSPQTREYLEKIGGSARHLLALINEILDMSRIESGRLVLRKEEFSFSAMIEQINTMVMSQCSDKGLHYECRILSPVDDYYIGDDMKLKEVIINILSNAVKFTNAPGSIELTIERTAVFEEQSTLKFCVKDTGIGMDKEYIPKIIEAFSQEDSSTKNKYGSTGLGMAITKNIVEMMNGTISVESEKGVGSVFTVVVTLRNAQNQRKDIENAVDLNKMRVLVVDDEEISAEHARMVLDEIGIRTDVCMSGAEALRMLEVRHLKQEPYNLVLMDWRMPDKDGIETAKEIRKLYNNETTVIILTAYSWDEVMEEALNSGIDSFLAKPLFASNVIAEFERVAHRNNMNMFREKKRAEIKGRRILFAEDMEINAEIMMDILEMEEVSADHAENGKIAVEMFQNSEPGKYSAILMDVRMPVMDVLEAASAIRALDRSDAKKIPIIALTANAFDEDVQRSLQAGMNAHLSKPVEPDHLYQTLEELIYEAESQN